MACERGSRLALETPRLLHRVLCGGEPWCWFLFGQTLGASTVRSRFASLFDTALATSMCAMPVVDERGYHLEGLMCPFDASHSNADLQFVYVNGRFVRAKPLTQFLQRFFAISNRLLSIDQSHPYGSREFKQRYVGQGRYPYVLRPNFIDLSRPSHFRHCVAQRVGQQQHHVWFFRHESSPSNQAPSVLCVAFDR